MKYLITGGSGYIGSRLTDLLVQHEDNEVVNLDIRAPAVPRSRTRFVHMDIRDRGIAALIAQERPDALVHLAFVLNPIRDEHTMYDIDVNGTANVLDAAAAAGVPHLLVASSTTAYGAWPDNPVPIPEEHPVRGLPGYEYARDKTEIDRLCQLWAAQHPESTMTIVRPTIVFGPNVDNYIVRFWENQPFVVLPDGHDADWQYVHEDDVVDAMSRLLSERRGGIFNLTADGTVKMSEAAAIAGKKVRKMPLKLYRRIGLRILEAAAAERRGTAGPDRVRAAPLDRLEREAQERARLVAALHEPRDLRDHDACEGARPAGPPGQRGGVRSGDSGSHAGRVVQRLNSDACRGA